MEEKKNLLTYAGLKALEDELHDLKVNRRKEVAGKIKEAREQGDLSENAEYIQVRIGYWKRQVYRAKTKEEIINDAFGRWKVAGYLGY